MTRYNNIVIVFFYLLFTSGELTVNRNLSAFRGRALNPRY
jgi:hypothetical protein